MHERTTDTTETAIPLPDQPARSYTAREGERARAMTSADAGHLAERARVSREPFARTERLLLTLLAGLFVLIAAVLSAGVLAFNSFSGQMLDLQEQIGSLRAEMHEEIGSLRAEMHEEMGKLSDRMTRIETLLETHLVPASDARDPAGS